MLLSMTGFGVGRWETPLLGVAVELRAVNHRHLKVVVRGSEPYSSLEAEFEKVLRKSIKRGSILVQIRVRRTKAMREQAIDGVKLVALIDQLKHTCEESGNAALLPHLVGGLLSVPGVVPESAIASDDTEAEWPMVEAALAQAAEQLHAARKIEGHATTVELRAKHAAILHALAGVKVHLPQVMSDYRTRLLDRIRTAVADAGIAVQPEHMVREIALYADRTDVNEEVHRLTGHLEQLDELLTHGAADGAGRRLEFLVQEMGREINTLGSKAGDVTISRFVFDMKSAAEQIREIVQNIE